MEHWLTKIPLRTIIGRTALFLALLAIGTAYFQQESNFHAFRDWYIGQCNYWIEDIRYPGRAEFRVHAQFPEIMKAELTNRNQIEAAMAEARRTGSSTIDARASAMTFRPWSFALLPIILCMSLIVALPGPWLYKPVQLIGGFAIIYFYTLLKVYFFTGIQFHNSPSLDILRYTGWKAEVISSAHLVLLSTTFNLAIAIMIALVTLGFKPLLGTLRQMASKLLLLTDNRLKRRRRRKANQGTPGKAKTQRSSPSPKGKPRKPKK